MDKELLEAELDHYFRRNNFLGNEMVRTALLILKTQEKLKGDE